MSESASSFLAPWATFYIMTGSSAATLIGLMFVVITLVTQTERISRTPDALGTFSTPTVLHFCGALLVAAVLSAPWRAVAYPGAFIALAGLFGVVYVIGVMFRTRRLTTYVPDLDDWMWYTILPLLAYGAVFAGGLALADAARQALFALAGGVLLLIFIGIRNAWDVVTFLVTRGDGGPSK